MSAENSSLASQPFNEYVARLQAQEWQFPHTMHVEPARRFISTSTSPADETNVNRYFLRPNPHPKYNMPSFTPFMRVHMKVPNFQPNTPNRYADPEIAHISQWDELERYVKMSQHSVTAEIDLGRIGSEDLPDLSFTYITGEANDSKRGILIMGDILDKHINRVPDPDMAQLAESPLVIPGRLSTILIGASKKLDQLNFVVSVGGAQILCQLPVAPDFFNRRIAHMKKDGILDGELFAHALDAYGPWDESYAHLDWAQELDITLEVAQ